MYWPMSARLPQIVVNQVDVASSSSAAEASVEESSLDVALEIALELELLEDELEFELELPEAVVTAVVGAAVSLLELQPDTSSTPAASALIKGERFIL